MNPWDAEVTLTAESVAGRIAAAFPALAPVRAEYFDEGWDSAVWRVNGEWLFRFVKRAEEVKFMRDEVRLLAHLASRVPVPVPRPEFVGSDFFGYRPVPGTSLSDVPAAHVDRASLARDLGRFLSALHACEPDGVRAASREAEKMRERARASLAKVEGKYALPKGVKARLEGPLPPAWTGRPRLVHNDLLAEHILVHPGGLSGVIDWTDAARGDTAADFAGFVHWGGRAFAEDVLAHYDGEVDAQLLERATWIAFCVGIFDVDFGLATGRMEYATEGVKVLERTL